MCLRLPIFALLLLLPNRPTFAQTENEQRTFVEHHRPYAALFALENGEQVIVGLLPNAGIMYLSKMKTGDMRFLQPEGAHRFSFGATRSVTRPAVGALQFTLDEEGIPTRLMLSEAGEVLQGQRSPLCVRIRV